MFRAIFFDLDQTLVDRSATFAAYLAKAYRDLALAERGVVEADFYLAIHRWDDNGYRAKPDTFQRAMSDLGSPELAEPLLAHFKPNYGHDARLFTGVKATLDVLKQQWPLALISNGRSLGQATKLKVTGIADRFQEILVSETEAIKKPDPEIYLRACERMSLQPEQVLFVGDHPVNDVQVPTELGMKAVWVENETYQPPQRAWAVVQSVVELPALLAADG